MIYFLQHISQIVVQVLALELPHVFKLVGGNCMICKKNKNIAAMRYYMGKLASRLGTVPPAYFEDEGAIICHEVCQYM